ncbi:MAG TPA: beta-ketoacyl synthase N-terminal-like domain-containing protein, partial [Polyangiaceae bacterium]|nr:beta-ketoacyl synthase N-terminal-like domain-containing protein [Polyangiaceae bacterium]
MLPRVFITGVGVVSSIGLGKSAFFRALREGSTGISPVTAFDASQLGRQFAGEVRNFDPRDHLTAAERGRTGRCSAM